MISGSMNPPSSMTTEQPATSKLMYPSLSEKHSTSEMQLTSGFMQPTSFEGQLFNTVLSKLAKKFVENSGESNTSGTSNISSSNSSSSNSSSSNTTRFFRDVGKKNEVTTNKITNTETKPKGPSYKELKEISKNNWRAQIETGFIGSTFGAPVAYILYYIGFVISLSFKLFILFIIFNICVIIHKAIQKILDVSHIFMGGIKNSVSGINNFLNQIGINFVVPGISIPAIRFRTGDLFKLNWYPFKNSLGGPLSKIDSAVRAIPRDATDVIINMIREMLFALIELIPKLFEGMIQSFEKIMK